MRSRATAALAVAVLSVLPTAGCYQGFDDTVNTQGPSGNGTDFEVGDLLVQDTTMVVDPENPRAGNLIMTIVNDGETDDALVSASLASGARGATEGPVGVPAGQATKTAVAFLGVAEPAGSYTTVTLTFGKAGSSTAEVLVVPAVGYYAEYRPTIDQEETAP